MSEFKDLAAIAQRTKTEIESLVPPNGLKVKRVYKTGTTVRLEDFQRIILADLAEEYHSSVSALGGDILWSGMVEFMKELDIDIKKRVDEAFVASIKARQKEELKKRGEK